MMINHFKILLKSGPEWFEFSSPKNLIIVNNSDDILVQLKSLDSHLQQGDYVAGFISYEAAPGLDSALETKEVEDFPLMVFGVFTKPKILKSLPKTKNGYTIGTWTSSQSPEYYYKNIKKIKDNIARGETYQVNYTMRLSAKFSGSSYAFFTQLVQNQKADYAAYVELDDHTICSVSPELFFNLDKTDLLCRPMKGTAARGLSYNDDIRQKINLYNSKKERAENLMIVDMIRNDMGKICQAGSVKVSSLFNTERYPTVWQLTSDVHGKTTENFSDIVQALFPCASITGAPKASTMKIIYELEQTPRKIYTGSIGYFSPSRKAQFNVAIRTALVDNKKEQVEYGVGGGIVWDSIDKNEYEECHLKAKVIKQKRIEFELLETMLATKGQGIFLLDYHIERLKNSAEYFKFNFNENKIRDELNRIIKNKFNNLKIRLLLSEDGSLKIESTLLDKEWPKSIKVNFANDPVNNSDPFLYHKTTNREVYQAALNQIKSDKIDDVLLFNEKNEITESTIANIVINKNEAFYTPPVECGLLNGTFRQYLVSQKKIIEKKLSKEDILNADGLFLINSVKKWQKAEI